MAPVQFVPAVLAQMFTFTDENGHTTYYLIDKLRSLIKDRVRRSGHDFAVVIQTGVDPKDYAEFIYEKHDVSAAKAWALTDEQLKEWPIYCLQPDDTHILIDGAHRTYRMCMEIDSGKRKPEQFKGYIIPLEALIELGLARDDLPKESLLLIKPKSEGGMVPNAAYDAADHARRARQADIAFANKKKQGE